MAVLTVILLAVVILMLGLVIFLQIWAAGLIPRLVAEAVEAIILREREGGRWPHREASRGPDPGDN